ncbi:uncharacterized protein natalisin, partial [Anabrus simplex]|uniref:uncharacterized protein natalisin n=1 Tax=Anabrus simplex TaxID=316456 RepID=UPI0035A2C6FE
SEEQPPPFWANRGRRERYRNGDDSLAESLDSQDLYPLSSTKTKLPGHDISPYSTNHNKAEEQASVEEIYVPWDSGRYRRVEPLFADEPHFIYLGRRKQELPVQISSSDNDHFWVARGRRYDGSSSSSPSSLEEPFWAARGRREQVGKLLWIDRNRRGIPELSSSDEPFWVSRGRRSGREVASYVDRRSSLEEPFWAARGRRSYMDPMSSEEPFWAARGRRGQRDSLSSEEPFWAARGKKSPIGHAFQDMLNKGKPRAVLMENDPFWAARGKRSNVTLQESSSSGQGKRNIAKERALRLYDPFWAARGKRDKSSLRALSMQDPFWAARGKRDMLKLRTLGLQEPFWASRGKRNLVPVRALGLQDPFWAARGKRDLESANVEDERFWSTLEQRSASHR